MWIAVRERNQAYAERNTAMERDSLREEIARRDADDPMDTEDRINMETGIIRGIIGDHDKRINDLDGIVTKLIDRVGAALLRLDEIKRTDEAN